ncbi:MAG TPA: porin [Rhodospirillales bacterium]|nr:porin [Rhodospirillales bacterium]
MYLKKALLGTTALLGVGAFVMADAGQAKALEVSVSGFSRFMAAFGDLEDQSGTANAREFYFRNDTEVHVKARGTDDATGMRYGATVEFEADTSATGNTDETWIFIGGNWGELRFGDEDGAADNMKVGGFSVAAGTGGIDGAGEVANTGVFFDNTSDATKIIYYSPTVSGFQLGVSFTPDSGHGGSTTYPTSQDAGQRQNWIEAGLTYNNSFNGVDVKGSVVLGRADYETNGDDFFAIGGGLVIGFSGFSVGGGYFSEDDDVGGDRDIWNVGASASLGPANLSVTYARIDNDGSNVDPSNIVLSADMGLFPGVALQGDVSFFDNDTGSDDDGVTGVVRLHIGY